MENKSWKSVCKHSHSRVCVDCFPDVEVSVIAPNWIVVLLLLLTNKTKGLPFSPVNSK